MCQPESTTAAAKPSMTELIGPQSSLSGRDGVIQFTTVEAVCRTKATQPVQSGQFGRAPAAELIARAIKSKMIIETNAAARPAIGSLP